MLRCFAPMLCVLCAVGRLELGVLGGCAGLHSCCTRLHVADSARTARRLTPRGAPHSPLPAEELESLLGPRPYRSNELRNIDKCAPSPAVVAACIACRVLCTQHLLVPRCSHI